MFLVPSDSKSSSPFPAALGLGRVASWVGGLNGNSPEIWGFLKMGVPLYRWMICNGTSY